MLMYGHWSPPGGLVSYCVLRYFGQVTLLQSLLVRSLPAITKQYTAPPAKLFCGVTECGGQRSQVGLILMVAVAAQSERDLPRESYRRIRRRMRSGRVISHLH
jgi:hypothetical protein